MKVGIVGSRRRRCEKQVQTLVATLPEDTVVVSGGCRGVDTWAREAALARGLQIEEYLPVPKAPGRWYLYRAYTARNRQIAQAIDVLYAFPAPDRKGGTEQTIQFAQKLGKPVILL